MSIEHIIWVLMHTDQYFLVDTEWRIFAVICNKNIHLAAKISYKLMRRKITGLISEAKSRNLSVLLAPKLPSHFFSQHVIEILTIFLSTCHCSGIFFSQHVIAQEYFSSQHVIAQEYYSFNMSLLKNITSTLVRVFISIVRVRHLLA